MAQEKSYWLTTVPSHDDFRQPIRDVFIDGRSRMGPWGLFTPDSWRYYGTGRLGVGWGQRYVRQDDGRWLKVEG